MATPSGHLLVPKIMRIVQFGISRTTAIIRSKLPQSTQSTSAATQYSLQPVRVYAQTQPIHPLAYFKQSRSSHQSRGFASTARTFLSATKRHTPRHDRSKFPVSRTSKAISQRGAAPFASTLRPNLTGGTLPRSAGGYSLGGPGARHFSHTSRAQAQVLQNVSTGIRAFLVGGEKARFDGVDPVTGEKRFRSVSQTEDAVYTQWESSLSKSKRGSNLDFKLSPTITALSPSFTSGNQQSTFDITSLNELNLIDGLATDFARALKDLAAILTDLRILSNFGDLPISLITTPSGPIIRVRFPGCDGDLVSCLCDEVGVSRGMIVEDEAWTAEKDVEMALLFPFAPTGSDDGFGSESDASGAYFEHRLSGQGYQPGALEWQNMLSPSLRTQSHSESVFTLSPPLKVNTPSDYDSPGDSDFESYDPYYHFSSSSKAPTHSASQSADYEGLEGIYKFLQECDDSRR